MPFAKQGGAVTTLLEQGRHGGVLGWQPQRGAALALAVDGLFRRAAQTVLIACGHERKARGRAHGAVGVALRKHHAVFGERIDHGRHLTKGGLACAIATQVCVAQIVGHNKNDVGSCHDFLIFI